MEVHQLRYVAAVAKTGNFSRAAEQSHVAQPSLSQQIQKLEEELGERLFHRLPREAKLTDAGRAFLPRALRILAEMETAKREASERRGLLRGQVAIGAIPTIAPYFLPDVISSFSAAHPGVEVIVQEEITGHLMDMCAEHEIDMAIASPPVHDERCESVGLFEEPLLLAMPVDHRLAAQRNIRLADLENERFILMREGHCLGEQVLNFCNRKDFHPRVSGRSMQIETILALVRSGAGVSLAPKMACNAGNERQLVFRSLEKPCPRRTIAVFMPRLDSLSRAAGEFLKHLRATNARAAGRDCPQR